MAEGTISSKPIDQDYEPRIKPERLAWGMLLGAFVVFCGLCLGSTFTVQYFFFQSGLPMQVTLQVSRGTVGVTENGGVEEAENDSRALSRETIVRTDQTDELSQASIILSDPAFENPLIANISIRGGTEVQFVRGVRPRFDWSVPDYTVELQRVSGRVDVFIAEPLRRPIDIRLKTESGVEIHLSESGRYFVDARSDEVLLTNYEGESLILMPESQLARSIPPGNVGLAQVEADAVTIEPAPVNLLENGALQVQQTGETIAVPGWSCAYHTANNLPSGRYFRAVAPDGRQALRLTRGENATNNGEVGCTQQLAEEPGGFGAEVSDYDYIALQATVRIESESLDQCGQEATECSLMLELNWLPDVPEGSTTQPGVVRRTFLGVYARDDATFNWRNRCDECLTDHTRIYDQVWYTFDTGNLLNILPPALHPEYIQSVRFYASGHNFDVYIDSIGLIVDQNPPQNFEEIPVDADAS